MKEAVVKGETHVSGKDKQALMDIDLNDFDAVFREGYDKNYFKRDITFLYALYAIGHLMYATTYVRFYFSTEEFREKVKGKGIPYFNEIDVSIPDTYDMVPRRKRLVIALISPFWAMFLIGLISAPFIWISQKFVSTAVSQILGFIGTIGLLLIFGLVWALGHFILVGGEVMYDRDEKMAEEILRITEKEEFNSILISCGGNHRPGIASHLRDNGWNVEERKTDSRIGKAMIIVGRVKKTILNPKKTLADTSLKLFS